MRYLILGDLWGDIQLQRPMPIPFNPAKVEELQDAAQAAVAELGYDVDVSQEGRITFRRWLGDADSGVLAIRCKAPIEREPDLFDGAGVFRLKFDYVGLPIFAGKIDLTDELRKLSDALCPPVPIMPTGPIIRIDYPTAVTASLAERSVPQCKSVAAWCYEREVGQVLADARRKLLDRFDTTIRSILPAPF